MDAVFLDNHLLAVNKPSGLPSQPDNSGDPSLIELAKAHIKAEFSKPGEAYLALLHRLDRPTSGLILMGRTDKAAGRMADQFRKREVEKTYFALVRCHAEPEREARLVNYLLPLENGGMQVVPRKGKANRAREAALSYVLLEGAHAGGSALLSIRLETGVKHQIRCQLAAAGLPVIGDFRYGPFGGPARPEPVMKGRAVLLHAARLGFTHPVRREPVSLAAPVPLHWEPYLRDLPSAKIRLLEESHRWQA